MFTADVFYNFS